MRIERNKKQRSNRTFITNRRKQKEYHMDIAIIGGEEFTLGFRLAGITHVVDLPEGKNPAEEFRTLLGNKGIAIIMTDNATLGKLNERMRSDVEQSVQPVVLTISAEESQEGLRRLIQKSIGVDLWKDK